MIEIWGKSAKTPAEEIDTAEDMKEARYLIGEYHLAFGPGWSFWTKKVCEPKET
jgi:hypothetical protein